MLPQEKKEKIEWMKKLLEDPKKRRKAEKELEKREKEEKKLTIRSDTAAISHRVYSPRITEFRKS